jgi:hypothetical protein
MTKIDYSKLNDRIVEQAYVSADFTMTEDQKQRLFQNKIDRAQAMLEAQKTVYFQLED